MQWSHHIESIKRFKDHGTSFDLCKRSRTCWTSPINICRFHSLLNHCQVAEYLTKDLLYPPSLPPSPTNPPERGHEDQPPSTPDRKYSHFKDDVSIPEPFRAKGKLTIQQVLRPSKALPDTSIFVPLRQLPEYRLIPSHSHRLSQHRLRSRSLGPRCGCYRYSRIYQRNILHVEHCSTATLLQQGHLGLFWKIRQRSRECLWWGVCRHRTIVFTEKGIGW
jgi:hypothetical protein